MKRSSVFWQQFPCARNSIFIDPFGDVRTDVVSTRILGNINESSLNSILSNRFDKINDFSFFKGCNLCFLKEEQLGRSHRSHYQNLSRDLPESSDKIYFLNISISNQCDSRCVICGGKWSSSWGEVEQILQSRAPELQRESWKESRSMLLADRIVTELKNQGDSFKELRWLIIKGGEPFLHHQLVKLLKHFNSVAPQINYDIITNGLTFNRELVEQLDRRPWVLNISCDGVAGVYDYVRGVRQGGFYQFEENLKRFSETSAQIKLTCSLSALNLFYIPELLSWFSSYARLGLKLSLNNLVVSPAYMNLFCLPLSIRRLVVERLKQVPLEHIKNVEGFDSLLDRLVNSLAQEPSPSQLGDYSQMKKFVKEYDRAVGKDVSQALPALSSLIF